MSTPDIHQVIVEQIKRYPVVLYMKGTPDFPQCGFSGRVVHVLESMGVRFKSFNVLEDEQLREGIKSFSNWPTIPQLYVNGELIGGSDIVGNLFERGELQKQLEDIIKAH